MRLWDSNFPLQIWSRGINLKDIENQILRFKSTCSEIQYYHQSEKVDIYPLLYQKLEMTSIYS